jgi:hypothetical protein
LVRSHQAARANRSSQRPSSHPPCCASSASPRRAISRAPFRAVGRTRLVGPPWPGAVARTHSPHGTELFAQAVKSDLERHRRKADRCALNSQPTRVLDVFAPGGARLEQTGGCRLLTNIDVQQARRSCGGCTARKLRQTASTKPSGHPGRVQRQNSAGAENSKNLSSLRHRRNVCGVRQASACRCGLVCKLLLRISLRAHIRARTDFGMQSNIVGASRIDPNKKGLHRCKPFIVAG